MTALRLAYDVQGEGDRSVVLLHGFTGSRESFSHVEPHLAGFRRIRLDLPGHGASGLPASSGEAGFLETLNAVARVLDDARVGAADIVGYSQGARVALGFAVHHPDRVGRLVLEGGTPGLKHQKDRAARRRQDEALAQEILRGGVPAFIERWEQNPILAGLRRLPPPAAQALRARRLANTAEGLAAALRCLGTGVQPDFWPSLWRVRVPTLLLTGAQDTRYTALAQEMAGQLPLVWRHAFAGVGHSPHLEAPDGWAQEVRTFLQIPWASTAS